MSRVLSFTVSMPSGLWHISYEPQPVPGPIHWSYHHDEFDGAPDSGDNRCGVNGSPEECLSDILEIEDSIEEDSNE